MGHDRTLETPTTDTGEGKHQHRAGTGVGRDKCARTCRSTGNQHSPPWSWVEPRCGAEAQQARACGRASNRVLPPPPPCMETARNAAAHPTTERGTSGTRAQRPTWLPCPASLSSCGGDGEEGNLSQDIDFNFLRIKKKTKPNRQKLPENSFLPHNFTEISLEMSSARTCSRLCLSPPAQPAPARAVPASGLCPPPTACPECQTPLPFMGPGRGTGGFGQPQWVLSPSPKLSSPA